MFQVEEGDGLPPNICEECLAMVEQMYLFKKKCKLSDSKLREHLEITELNEECKLDRISFSDAIDSNVFEVNFKKVMLVIMIRYALSFQSFLILLLLFFQNEKSNEKNENKSSSMDSGGTVNDETSDNLNADNAEENERRGKTKNETNKDGEMEETQDFQNSVQNEIKKEKTIISEVKRYILKGEKLDDGQEDLTVFEIVPLDVRNDDHNQYSNGDDKTTNEEEGEEDEENGDNVSIKSNSENKGGDIIREIYQLWDNEDDKCEEEEEEESENAGDKEIFLFNVICNDDGGVIEISENTREEKSESETKTRKVYSNKNHVEIVEKTNLQQVKSFKCVVCSDEFYMYSAMKEHLSKVHKDVAEVPYCEICGKSFTCTNSLKRHMTVHTGAKPYKCNICGRKFSQGSILKRHVLTHENLKPYNCHFCQKSYTQKMNLLTHLKNHGFRTGSENFSCKLCNKSFVHQSGLSRHVKLHKGVRFLCLNCKKTFVDASALARHVKISHQQ